METDTGSTSMWTGTIWTPISTKGAIDIHDRHVHTKLIGSFYHIHVGLVETITVATAKNDNQINVSDASNWVVGDQLDIINAGTSEPTEPQIIAIAANLVTLDRPLNFAWPIGTEVQKISDALNVATPTSFKVTVPVNESWHIETIMLTMTINSEGDDTKFGDIDDGLDNGCVLRVYSGSDDQFFTFANWKNNADIGLNMKVEYHARSGGGKRGFAGHGDILNRTGAVPQIRGTEGDYLEFLTQDDLSSLHGFRIKVLGHLEE
ncbi:MAG: hypothetical protein GY799_28780 [Desulfobulbaceae bacterium]|nr:hypothetical protein [Desulfobulbaceae bacterium]